VDEKYPSTVALKEETMILYHVAFLNWLE